MEGEKHLLERRASDRMLDSIIGIMIELPTEPAWDADTSESAARAPMISNSAKMRGNKIRAKGCSLMPINRQYPISITGQEYAIKEKKKGAYKLTQKNQKAEHGSY